MQALGWVLMVIGTGLAAGMAYLIVVIARIIGQSDDPNATSRFEGTPAQRLMVYGILGLVLVIGIVSVVAGAWQARQGTRNPRLVKLVLRLAFAFITIGVLLQAFS